MAQTDDMQTAMKCTVLGCPKTARWQVGFRVWPCGITNRVKRNAVEALTGICVCDEHAIRDPARFFTAKGKERIAVGFLQAGRGMPDFSTAQIIHTEITEGEPITMEEASRLGGLPDAES